MNPLSSALLTDYYQLTMLQAYFAEGLREEAVFELFVRRLPDERHFLMVAGLESVIDYLQNLRFGEEELLWLERSGRFDPAFIRQLAGLRFTGDLDAMPEGTIFFADEPVLRIRAPLPEAQFVETRIMNLVHFQTLIASKAARAVLAAPGKLLIDFGLRRSHGAEAGLMAARSTYLAGFAGTATVLAEALYGIPVYGTMAHSFIQAHDRETDAFWQFARSQPDNALFLLDTYDTERAARRLVELWPRLKAEGVRIKGVRIDSGDLAVHSRRVRRILDEAGLKDAIILASGNLDEYELFRLSAAEAPIDAYGIGTRLDTSADAPYLDFAYKLQEYAGRPRRKRSEGKATWPGAKQVYRHYDPAGRFAYDVVGLADAPGDGEPLLRPYLRRGERVNRPTGLVEARAYAKTQLERLPPALTGLSSTAPYEVRIAEEIRRLAGDIDTLRV